MAVLSKRTVFSSSGGTPGDQAREDAALRTVYLIKDTHYGGLIPELDGTGNITDANDRQVTAINNLVGAQHPLGGFVHRPSLVIQVGDAKHENIESVNRFASHYTKDGSGAIKYPCYFFDGNHDQNDVRSLITARYGSLNWGVKVGPVWFQAMTEDYTAENISRPPSPATMNGPVAASLATRPPREPTFLMFHRALFEGWQAEWDDADTFRGDAVGTSLNTLETLANSRNTIGIIHGHDHESRNNVWRGYQVISPGSVAQFPLLPPHGIIFPETIAVLRIGRNWYDFGSYIFGFNDSRVWTPGVWEWTGRVSFSPT